MRILGEEAACRPQSETVGGSTSADYWTSVFRAGHHRIPVVGVSACGTLLLQQMKSLIILTARETSCCKHLFLTPGSLQHAALLKCGTFSLIGEKGVPRSMMAAGFCSSLLLSPAQGWMPFPGTSVHGC